MTDKEKIIIDGKGCRYKTWDAECSLTGDHYGDNMEPCKFIDEKSCYFKQLARKTQECEELKKQLMQKDEVNAFFNTPIEGWSSNPCDICEIKNNHKQLKEEYTELKLENKELYRILADLKEVRKLKDRHRKALEEIVGIAATSLSDDHDPAEGLYGEMIKILDIINKAKDGKNEN